MSSYYRRSSCRLCGSEKLSLVLNLEPTPPANAFVLKEELNQSQERYPLDVFFCEDCAHVQLLDVVDPKILFENYVYVSGTSPVFIAHFESYATEIINRFCLQKSDLVVDIGSNDGTLLRFFKEARMQVLGVDPAKEIARRATESGIETIPVFFTPEIAAIVRKRMGSSKVVIANNVFAHVDDMQAFVRGVKKLLSEDGVFVFEVSYLVDIYTKTLFDSIYHEHLAYHTVKPLVRLFEENDMILIEALRVDTHGGSLRGIAQLSWGWRSVGESVAEALSLEKKLGLDQKDTFRTFAAKIDDLKRKLGALLNNFKAQGKRIAGFGAPAKATTLMYHFGIGPEIIDFIVDDSPLKQGLYSPGHHIQVLPASAIYERNPDCLLVLAWNFAESIMRKHNHYKEAGGKFIVPLPELRVY